jgi:N utilization substance protein B
MGKRREGREAAVQFLFAHDLHGEHTPEEQEAFWEIHNAKPSVREHAETLARGVLAHREEIDALIAPVLQNFRLERVANVDRNILRLAVYELLHQPEVPAPVILNEAIEIAKSLGAGESGGFVNGILDQIARRTRPNAPNRKAAEQD